MDKNKQNEELQSRRDFFKSAAKSVLPILGAVVLASNPVIAKAAETPMGCTGTCYGLCKNACTSCKYTCDSGCKNGCTGCKYSCQGSSK